MKKSQNQKHDEDDKDDEDDELVLLEPSPQIKEDCVKLIISLRDDVKHLTLESKKYQDLLKCVEEKNTEEILADKIDTSSLYPSLNDPKFTEKISVKKEFNDVKIEKKSRKDIDNIEEGFYSIM